MNKIIPVLEKKYGPSIGEGRNRLVFGNKNVVIKIPKNPAGVSDNEREYNKYIKTQRYYKSIGQEIPPDVMNYAACRIKEVDDIPILMMERLTTSVPFKQRPSWERFVDSGQIGKDKKGTVKVYDYGDQ